MPTTSTVTVGDLCFRARRLANPRARLLLISTSTALSGVGATATWTVAADFPPPAVGSRLTYMTATNAVDVLVTAVSGQALTVLSLAQSAAVTLTGVVAEVNGASSAYDTYQAVVDAALTFSRRVPYVATTASSPAGDDRSLTIAAAGLLDVLAVTVQPAGTVESDLYLPAGGWRQMPSTLASGVEGDGLRVLLSASTALGDAYQVWYATAPTLTHAAAMSSLASTLDSVAVNNTLADGITWDAAASLLLLAERVRLLTDTAGESRTPQEVREATQSALARQYQARAEQAVIREEARFRARFPYAAR